MDPDETEMFIDAFWWRLEIEDRKQAHYTAQQLSAATGKKIKPKKIKFLAEWHEDDGDSSDTKELDEKPAADSKSKKPSPKRRSAEEEKAAFKRLKEFSKQRAREHRGG